MDCIFACFSGLNLVRRYGLDFLIPLPYLVRKYAWKDSINFNWNFIANFKRIVCTKLWYANKRYNSLFISSMIEVFLLQHPQTKYKLSKPKFNQNSIELNLRLDYVLTARSTHPTTTTTQTICCCCAAQASQVGRLYNYTVATPVSSSALRSTRQMFHTIWPAKN